MMARRLRGAEMFGCEWAGRQRELEGAGYGGILFRGIRVPILPDELRLPRRGTLRRARPALGPRPALRVPARAASRWDASTHGRCAA
jgi:hypothetical protein